jgi:hypothetical protein
MFLSEFSITFNGHDHEDSALPLSSFAQLQQSFQHTASTWRGLKQIQSERAG